MSREADFFRAVAARALVRIRVAAIVIRDQRLLVQRLTDDPAACFAFIGGEYEVGDTFESRLRREFEEETTAQVVRAEYRFVVENRFLVEGRLIHSLEHYVDVEIDRAEVRSTETGLSQHWLPFERLGDFDLRPWVVRDAIATGEYRRLRHLVVAAPRQDTPNQPLRQTGPAERFFVA